MYHESAHLKYLTKFASDTQTKQHQVAKRQNNDGNTPTPEDKDICTAELNDVSCTTGAIQGIIEARLICGGYISIEEAQREANACAKHEGGRFCSSLFTLNRIQANYVDGNCSRVLAMNICPSSCRTLLEDFRSTLGCCINAYVNGTNFFLRNSLDYRVWNLCNVPLPPAACGNSPTINPPDKVQNCTSEDVFNKYYVDNICSPEHRRPFVEVLRRLGTSVCGDTTPSSVEDTCSVDANGVPCGLLYIRFMEDIASLESACSTSDVICTSNCRDRITSAINRNGCCLQSFWFTSVSAALSSSVLKSCDIKLPETCEGVIGSAQSIMKESYMLLITAGLMCLQLLIIA